MRPYKDTNGQTKIQKITHGLSSDIFVNKSKKPPSLYDTAECTVDGKERKRGGLKLLSCFFFLLLLPKHG